MQKELSEEIQYVGFKPRLYAMFIDTFLLLPIIYLLFPESVSLNIPPEAQILIGDYSSGIIGREEFTNGLFAVLLEMNSFSNNSSSIIQYIVIGIIIVLFWVFKSATPGKILLSMKIVDVKTNGKPSNIQLIVRYIGYFLSSIPPFIGFLWIAMDKKKQGWHDKIARTVVIYSAPRTVIEERTKKFKRKVIIVTFAIIAILLLIRVIGKI